jgi:cyclopropane fatty-acyl-phospholipid synthase-like methyltransferase
MKPYIDWKPTRDPHLRVGERKLHEQLHTLKSNDLTARKDRLKHISLGESLAKKKIAGMVLDIGCGNGYSSVHIAKTRDVKQIHAMECNVPAVDKLIRKNFVNNKIPESKYELILGSFNNIRNKNYYDFVVAMGAIHHSSNLLRTMKEVYGCLKMGGIFIAHEPFMIDTTPNKFFIQKENTIKKVQGLVAMKESDRDDHFFRKCEYLTAFYHSGFDVTSFHELGKDQLKSAVMVLQKTQPIRKFPHDWV